MLSVMQCTHIHVSQFLRLSCVLYVTALEAYWCTEASAALLLSLVNGSQRKILETSEKTFFKKKMKESRTG